MENLLHIGSKIDKSAVSEIQTAIVSILEASQEYRIPENITKEALNVLSNFLVSATVTIENCNFNGGKEGE